MYKSADKRQILLKYKLSSIKYKHFNYIVLEANN